MAKIYLGGGRRYRDPALDMAVTASHTPQDGRLTLARAKIPPAAELVQIRLNALHDQLGTWGAVSLELGGLDRGLLCRVANGTQPAPRTVKAVILPPRWVKDAAEWLGQTDWRRQQAKRSVADDSRSH